MISTADPMWKAECERLYREGAIFRIVDISCVEHIEFVSRFAAIKNLNMMVEERTFVLSPREI